MLVELKIVVVFWKVLIRLGFFFVVSGLVLIGILSILDVMV